MSASRRNPRSPDWSGLDAYLRHMGGPAAPLRTPGFDQYITDAQKTEASILKQGRLVREETSAEEKRTKPTGDGKGKAKAKGAAKAEP